MRVIRCVLCECPILADERAVDAGADRWMHAQCSDSFVKWIGAAVARHAPAPLVDPFEDETLPRSA